MLKILTKKNSQKNLLKIQNFSKNPTQTPDNFQAFFSDFESLKTHGYLTPTQEQLLTKNELQRKFNSGWIPTETQEIFLTKFEKNFKKKDLKNASKNLVENLKNLKNFENPKKILSFLDTKKNEEKLAYYLGMENSS